METLEKLKNKYKKLQEESSNIYSKIRALENKKTIPKFTAGDCYLDTRQDNLIKIVSIQGNYVYYICLDNLSICRENSCLFYIQGWKKNYIRTIQKCLSCYNERYARPRLGR